jgi:hypothetical protein
MTTSRSERLQRAAGHGLGLALLAGLAFTGHVILAALYGLIWLVDRGE